MRWGKLTRGGSPLCRRISAGKPVPVPNRGRVDELAAPLSAVAGRNSQHSIPDLPSSHDDKKNKDRLKCYYLRWMQTKGCLGTGPTCFSHTYTVYTKSRQVRPSFADSRSLRSLLSRRRSLPRIEEHWLSESFLTRTQRHPAQCFPFLPRPAEDILPQLT